MNNISLNLTIDFEQTIILAVKLIFPNVIVILTNVFVPKYKIYDLNLHLSTKNQVKLI